MIKVKSLRKKDSKIKIFIRRHRDLCILTTVFVLLCTSQILESIILS